MKTYKNLPVFLFKFLKFSHVFPHEKNSKSYPSSWLSQDTGMGSSSSDWQTVTADTGMTWFIDI